MIEELRFRKGILERTGKVECRIISDSMEPLIAVDEIICVEKLCSIQELRRFDILVFLHQETFFCHYLWHVNRLSLVPTVSTRSLKSIYHNDMPTPIDLILGRVTSKAIPRWTRLKITLMNLWRGTG